MSTPYLSELRLVSFNFAPRGWTMCNGALLSIQTNQALFSLLGTTYGGDGIRTFGLPQLQGRVPISFGPGYVLGQAGGETNHTLAVTEMPSHTHVLQGTNVAFSSYQLPTNHMLCNTTGNLLIYGAANNLQAMNAGNITQTGGSQPHNNQSPYLTMTWIIALQGIFPSQN
jgi:microcystin-dependent protein